MFGTSRMTRSILRYIARTGLQAFRSALHANPLGVFGRLAALFAIAAAITVSYFLASYASGGMHLPTLLAAVLLALVAAALFICGLLADGIAYNRRLLEDGLQRIKRIEAEALAHEVRARALEPARPTLLQHS
jgi:hypothetical protein